MSRDDEPPKPDIGKASSFASFIEDLKNTPPDPAEDGSPEEDGPEQAEPPGYTFNPPTPTPGGDSETLRPEDLKGLSSTPPAKSFIETLKKEPLTPVFNRARERDIG